METLPQIDSRELATKLGFRQEQVDRVISLLDEGNTVPFITRYRKDQTGGLDEEQIRAIEAELKELRQFLERKQVILRSIESQGKLDPELRRQIAAAKEGKVLEDLYLPFKPKRQTLASAARERGLEPLALTILSATSADQSLEDCAQSYLNAEKEVATTEEALQGAQHILAEQISEKAPLRGKLREQLWSQAQLVCEQTAAAKEDAPTKKGPSGSKSSAKDFQDYFDFSQPLQQMPPHRILAINRGEREKYLRIKVNADLPQMQATVEQDWIPADHPYQEFLTGCCRDSLQRLILPSLEREARRELTEQAERHAISVFVQNLRGLLLQPPVRGKRVLAIDPGFRTGCKIAAIDEWGNLLEHDVIYIIGSDEKKAAGRQLLVDWLEKHQFEIVAIGNGTACRETEELISQLIQNEWAEKNVRYVIVNEAGASIYSASQVGREEFPEYDATLRGTMSIGRRLQDPLSELVKISPQHLGVGLYQHDLKEKELKESLDQVVESSVNFVGVDLNTASVSLLQYVSGLNPLLARRIVERRQSEGRFQQRADLKKVSGIGEVTFTQAAGFLKIHDGENPLDATWIHPENYAAAQKLLEKMEKSTDDLKNPTSTKDISESSKSLQVETLSQELEVGELTLKDILDNLARPGRDPREDLPPPVFKEGILKLDDLQKGMELTGTVLNVVDFGAFVDIGLKDSGLVHISQLAPRFVKDPHQIVAVGDIVTVWVLDIDEERKRVSLTLISPAEQEQAKENQKPAPTSKPSFSGRKPNKEPSSQATKPRPSSNRPGKSHQHSTRPPRQKGPRKSKPAKPLTPLSEEKKEGKEPLTSFSDLWQLMQSPEKDGKKGPKKSDS
ncbi:Competence protein ComEA helix-hairpin-helix repeat region [Planctomycetales bacterium 10988]|nr:Competence protein ComEA helix-hairpin-helix repeat region [Planctomycetales bacterium 10988]